MCAKLLRGVTQSSFIAKDEFTRCILFVFGAHLEGGAFRRRGRTATGTASEFCACVRDGAMRAARDRARGER